MWCIGAFSIKILCPHTRSHTLSVSLPLLLLLHLTLSQVRSQLSTACETITMFPLFYCVCISRCLFHCHCCTIIVITVSLMPSSSPSLSLSLALHTNVVQTSFCMFHFVGSVLNQTSSPRILCAVFRGSLF